MNESILGGRPDWKKNPLALPPVMFPSIGPNAVNCPSKIFLSSAVTIQFSIFTVLGASKVELKVEHCLVELDQYFVAGMKKLSHF